MSENVKTERVRKVFAETARQMIFADGIESVSVRKIAEAAGYSQGTVYNHFTSMDEILWHARSLMIEDLGVWMTENNPDPVTDKTGLKKMFTSYLTYFIERPNVYRFFYFHALDVSAKKTASLADAPGFADQVLGTFQFVLQSGHYTLDEVKTIAHIILYSVQGILTLLVSGNDGTDKDGSLGFLADAVEFLLRDIK